MLVNNSRVWYYITRLLNNNFCRCGGMADAPDSKSGDGNIVRVQVSSPASVKRTQIIYRLGFIFCHTS